MMGNLHPLRQLAVLMPRFAHYPFEGRGGELRDQKLRGGEARAQQAATNLPAERRNAAASSDPKEVPHQG